MAKHEVLELDPSSQPVKKQKIQAASHQAYVEDSRDSSEQQSGDPKSSNVESKNGILTPATDGTEANGIEPLQGLPSRNIDAGKL